MCQFERGPGPLVSILIPSRGRTGLLAAAMDSCLSLSRFRSLEFLVKADDDDPATAEFVQRVAAAGVPARVLVSPRGRGYLDMHLWAAELSRHARGDWLFLFNDDAVIETEGWDLHLALADPGCLWHGVGDVALCIFRTAGKPLNTEFIAVRRKVIELLGHWAGSPHNDTWLVSIMRDVGSALHCPEVQIRHANDAMDDGTRRDVLAAMAPDAGDCAYNSIPHIRARLEDARKLTDYLEAKMKESDR